MTVHVPLEKATHTLGPWVVVSRFVGPYIIQAPEGDIAHVNAPSWGENMNAIAMRNAQLIASAPDLLAALETVKCVLQGDKAFDIMLTEQGPCLGDVVRDAINRARDA